MKALLLVVLFTAFGSAQALTLDCYPRADSAQFTDNSNVGDAGLEKNWTGSCIERGTKTKYSARVIGFGVSAHWALKQGFLLQCPGLTNPTGVYKGIDAMASIFFGVSAGVFVKDTETAGCVMFGMQFFALGAQVTGTQLVVK